MENKNKLHENYMKNDYENLNEILHKKSDPDKLLNSKNIEQGRITRIESKYINF